MRVTTDAVQVLGGAGYDRTVEARELLRAWSLPPGGRDAHAARRARIESGEEKIVGVNSHVTDDDAELEILRISHQVERAQNERLARYRADRDQHAVDDTLAKLRTACGTDANLIPVIMDTVRASATLAEICAAMQDVFGTYREPPVI